MIFFKKKGCFKRAALNRNHINQSTKTNKLYEIQYFSLKSYTTNILVKVKLKVKQILRNY